MSSKIRVMMLRPHKKLDKLTEYTLSREYGLSLIRKGYAIRSNQALKREVERRKALTLARGTKRVEPKYERSKGISDSEVSGKLFDPNSSTKAEISEWLHEHRVEHSMRQRKDELVALVEELYTQEVSDGEV